MVHPLNFDGELIENKKVAIIVIPSVDLDGGLSLDAHYLWNTPDPDKVIISIM